jgi:hypothetical protein
MSKQGLVIWIAATALLMAAPAFAQNDVSSAKPSSPGSKASGQGQAVVTILAKHSELPVNVSQQDVSIKVGGKPSLVTSWVPLRGANDKLELVLLIDSSARNLDGSQFDEIKNFLQGLTPSAKVAVAYMQNGRAVLTGPLSVDREQALRGLHLAIGPTASPYFSLSDLAQHWPSADGRTRREVILVTDGVEPYNRGYDPNNSYVQAAINDSVRAGLVVYSIYWRGRNRATALPGGNDTGANYLVDVTRATGGTSYWTGNDNPVSLQPYFEDLARRLDNQYELGFSASLRDKPAIEALRLKFGGFAVEVAAPQQVLVDRAPAE